MPVDWTKYPAGWREFSHEIRYLRAQQRCECVGQCGLHQPNPTTRRCTERHHQPATYARGTVRLTTAHLCNCNPICKDPSHVRAMCQRCHLRLDAQKHAMSRLRTLAAKAQAPKQAHQTTHQAATATPTPPLMP